MFRLHAAFGSAIIHIGNMPRGEAWHKVSNKRKPTGRPVERDAKKEKNRCSFNNELP